MNFLFDQSADFRLIAHLRHLGHDVAVISRDYPPVLPMKMFLLSPETSAGFWWSPTAISAS